jgi:plastocyanin
MLNRTASIALFISCAVLAACGGKKSGGGESGAGQPQPTSGAKPTGNVIVVKLITDEKGSRFEPADLQAHPGDVIRFTLGVGVHNVHFPADSNKGVANLPEPSEMLQLPEQTYDFPVNLPSGQTYFFQCDPHAALGMVGHLKVD